MARSGEKRGTRGSVVGSAVGSTVRWPWPTMAVRRRRGRRRLRSGAEEDDVQPLT